jgi:hypothetical protein
MGSELLQWNWLRAKKQRSYVGGAATRHVLDRQRGQRCTPYRQFHAMRGQFHAMRVLARAGLGLSDRP